MAPRSLVAPLLAALASFALAAPGCGGKGTGTSGTSSGTGSGGATASSGSTAGGTGGAASSATSSSSGGGGMAMSSRFPDTSATIAVLADQLPNLSAGQQTFAATHFVGSQKLTLDQSGPLRAINPAFLVNPSSSPVTVTLGATMKQVVPSGGGAVDASGATPGSITTTPVTQVTVAATGAEILLP